MRILSIIKRIPLWAYILALAAITFSGYIIDVSSDMAWYMDLGMNLYLGRGYTDIDTSMVTARPPLFPMMLALAFRIFGLSVSSAFRVVWLFAVLNPLMIYFLGKKLYGNRWIGFAAAMMMLTSYTLNFWSYRHLDAIWPFFALLGMFCIFVALEEKKTIWFIFAGLALGAAFLVKESAIVFFPLPFLAFIFIREYRQAKNLWGVILFYLISAGILAAAGIYLNNTDWLWLRHPLEYRISGVIGTEKGLSVFSLFKSYFAGLGSYIFSKNHDYSLSAVFPLYPIFIIAWIDTIISAFKANKSGCIFTVFLLLFSPVLSRTGAMDLRVGQGIIFIAITYLITANFLLKFARYITVKWHESRQYLFYAAVVVIFIGIQFIAGGKRELQYFARSFIGSRIARVSGIDVAGLLQTEYGRRECFPELASWITANLPAGGPIMIDGSYAGRAVYFYTRGAYPVFIVPFRESREKREALDNAAKLIFVSAWSKECGPKNRFYFLSEPGLFEQIIEHEIGYVITTRQSRNFSAYFSDNPSFILAHQIVPAGINIFRIKRLASRINFPVIITEEALKFKECFAEKG